MFFLSYAVNYHFKDSYCLKNILVIVNEYVIQLLYEESSKLTPNYSRFVSFLISNYSHFNPNYFLIVFVVTSP